MYSSKEKILLVNNTRYVSGKYIKSHIDIFTTYLQTLANKNYIRYIRMVGGKRLYSLEDINILFQYKNLEINTLNIKRRICYARVSSRKQINDLVRQQNDLEYLYPNNEMISDIASGLNWNRKGLKTILDASFRYEIEELIILYKDRLCRFGYELLEYIFINFNVKLVVVNKDVLSSPTNELSEDLLAVVNFFVARNNGRRANENRRKRILKTTL